MSQQQEREKQAAIVKIESAVHEARWTGLSDDEIRALFTAALLKKGGA